MDDAAAMGGVPGRAQVSPATDAQRDHVARSGHDKTVQEKVETLFRVIRPGPGPKTYTYEQIQDRARELGFTLSDSTVQNMRNGTQKNPTRDSMRAVAAVFGVSPAYFMDDAVSERIDQELELLAILQNPAVRAIAARLPDLPQNDQVLLVGIIEQMRKISASDEDAPA